MFGPRPRFRFYGVPRNYFIALDAFLRGKVATGDDVQELERSLQTRLGIAHAVAVSQARVGIHLVMKHALGKGKEVILSPYTIYDVVNMVIAAGAKPVFCDIDPSTCNIDLEKAKALVNERTAAILITHLHGLAADAVAFRKFCDAHRLYLIEDAAQAFGARIGERYAGTIGHAGIYSFGRVKNVNGFFGGAVVTHDAELAAKIRGAIAAWPQMEPALLLKRIVNCLIGDVATMPIVFPLLTFWLFRYGCLHNIKSINKIVDTEDHPVRRNQLPERYMRAITPLQARMISAQLDTVEAHNKARIKHAMEYADGLATLDFLELPPRRTNGSHIYMAYPVQVSDRSNFVKHMMRHGCDIAIQHYNNTADLECFRDVSRDCPITRRVSRCVVLLPTYPGFGSGQVRHILTVAKKYAVAPEVPYAEHPAPPNLG
jgi:dTDP-4-amino-4,6-dideoxygalactose transaminase